LHSLRMSFVRRRSSAMSWTACIMSCRVPIISYLTQGSLNYLVMLLDGSRVGKPCWRYRATR
jgi:hypothetical protein